MHYRCICFELEIVNILAVSGDSKENSHSDSKATMISKR